MTEGQNSSDQKAIEGPAFNAPSRPQSQDERSSQAQDNDANGRNAPRREYGSQTTNHYDTGPQASPKEGKTDGYRGRRIADKWCLDERIGKGGMSVVYKAHHISIGKTVAVKLLLPHLVEEMKSQQRFAREAKAASSLNHPNVMTVQDYGMTDEGEAYIIMDYLEGRSLADIVQLKGRIGPEQACDVFYQTALGLDHAHSRGVVHRDLKPSNLMIVTEGNKPVVKIVDFGIAKVMLDYETGQQNLTKTGEVFGSPYYMSPEQCKGKQTDGRADIYSMGCLMYEALCGKPPFIGENSLETMFQHLNDEPNWLVRHNSPDSLLRRLDEVVQKCLEKAPEGRYQTAVDLALDLQRAKTASTGAWYSKALAARTPRTLKARGGWKWKLLQAAKVLAVSLVILTVLVYAAYAGYDFINRPFESRKSYQNQTLSPRLETPQPSKDRGGMRELHEHAFGLFNFTDGVSQDKLEELQSARKWLESQGNWETAGEVANKRAEVQRKISGRTSIAEAFDHFYSGKDLYFAGVLAPDKVRSKLDVLAEQQLVASKNMLRSTLGGLIHDGNNEAAVSDIPSGHLLFEPLKFLEQLYEDENRIGDALRTMRETLGLNDTDNKERQLEAWRYAELLRRSNTYVSSHVGLRSALEAYDYAFKLYNDMQSADPDPAILARLHYGAALTCWQLFQTPGGERADLRHAKTHIVQAIGFQLKVNPQDFQMLGSMQADYSDILWQEGSWVDALVQRLQAARTLEKFKS
ncbi:MAG TPA: serine/threonine-protein kinase [Planktothrix sp.]|jgi:serine/threonine protein kinase